MPKAILRELLLKRLGSLVQPNKVTILYGARQVGKTSLVREYLRRAQLDSSEVYENSGDDLIRRNHLSELTIPELRKTLAKYKLIFIDEAQKITDIDLLLKKIVDNVEGVKIIVTGSSSLDLSQKITESLAGRKNVINIAPIAFAEFSDAEHLEERLVYGSYPEIITAINYSDKKSRLEDITNSLLFKDVLEMNALKNSDKLIRLSQLLAFQIGQEVSTSELATSLGIDKNTVEHYIDILEKIFLIFRLPAFSTNPRKEISKMQKIYFYDLGIRNALIQDWGDINNRRDLGKIWENFIVVERLKLNNLLQHSYKGYFWRSYTKQEIDFIEATKVYNPVSKDASCLTAYEIKWQDQKIKVPSLWKEEYPAANFKVISTKNYQGFISD
jgi:predicted AAA+ superfamily ATPase